MSEITKIEILKKLFEGRDDVSPSITELAGHVGKSLADVHGELQDLVEKGYVKGPPKPHIARAYRITQEGVNYLASNGYIRANTGVFSNSPFR